MQRGGTENERSPSNRPEGDGAARNTVDSLTTVRKLKEKGVEAYFQKGNTYTLDSKGELPITLMSSLAQEEGRSIPENVTWGCRKRFQPRRDKKTPYQLCIKNW